MTVIEQAWPRDFRPSRSLYGGTTCPVRAGMRMRPVSAQAVDVPAGSLHGGSSEAADAEVCWLCGRVRALCGQWVRRGFDDLRERVAIGVVECLRCTGDDQHRVLLVRPRAARMDRHLDRDL